MRPLDGYIKDQLNEHIASIGEQLGNVDTMAIVSPIVPGIDKIVRDAVEMNGSPKD